MNKLFAFIPLLIACDGYSNSMTAKVTVSDYYESTNPDYSSYGFRYECNYITDPSPQATPNCDHCTNYGYVKLDYYNEAFDDLDEKDESVCSSTAFGFNTDTMEAYIGAYFDKLQASEYNVVCEMNNDFSATCTNSRNEEDGGYNTTHDYTLELTW